jgi:predicted MFS family arabinose efflux permease
MAGVYVASLVGLAIALGAVFGALYKVPSPANLVPVYAAVWLILGVIVVLTTKGREPASTVLGDLRSEGA